MTARACTMQDVEWLLDTCQKLYWQLQDTTRVRHWISGLIVNDNAFVWRTESALILAQVSTPPWSDIPLASAPFFAGHPIGVVRLFCEAKKWARAKGAKKLHFRSTTEHDIEKLVKALGAGVEYPAYSLEL